MKHPEAAMLRAVFTAIFAMEGKYPFLRLAFHPKNEGQKRFLTAVRDKQCGLRAGVPDIMLPVPCGALAGLAIELKADDNKATPKQLEYMSLLTENKWVCYVINDAQKAIDVIKSYCKLVEDMKAGVK